MLLFEFSKMLLFEFSKTVIKIVFKNCYRNSFQRQKPKSSLIPHLDHKYCHIRINTKGNMFVKIQRYLYIFMHIPLIMKNNVLSD